MLRSSLAIGMGLEASIASGFPGAEAPANFFLELAVSM
jgi:hypothetical protein